MPTKRKSVMVFMQGCGRPGLPHLKVKEARATGKPVCEIHLPAQVGMNLSELHEFRRCVDTAIGQVSQMQQEQHASEQVSKEHGTYHKSFPPFLGGTIGLGGAGPHIPVVPGSVSFTINNPSPTMKRWQDRRRRQSKKSLFLQALGKGPGAIQIHDEVIGTPEQIIDLRECSEFVDPMLRSMIEDIAKQIKSAEERRLREIAHLDDDVILVILAEAEPGDDDLSNVDLTGLFIHKNYDGVRWKIHWGPLDGRCSARVVRVAEGSPMKGQVKVGDIRDFHFLDLRQVPDGE